MKLKAAIRPYNQRARAQAAAATAQRILEAFLERLMKQWFDEITLDDVAEDAGVTVQTVVRRFGGKEGLLSSAVKTLGAQITARRAAPTGELERLVENLIKDYEETGDPVIRLLALEPRHPALKEVLDFGRSGHRRWVASGFADALGAMDVATRQKALDALVIATDVYTWKLLRRDMARSVSTTENTIKLLIQATLTQFTKPN
jgi:AcrR family transcriptional regulator